MSIGFSVKFRPPDDNVLGSVKAGDYFIKELVPDAIDWLYLDNVHNVIQHPGITAKTFDYRYQLWVVGIVDVDVDPLGPMVIYQTS